MSLVDKARKIQQAYSELGRFLEQFEHELEEHHVDKLEYIYSLIEDGIE